MVRIFKKAPGSCAWASIQFDDSAKGWVNAIVALTSDKGWCSRHRRQAAPKTPSLLHGWGSIPMMTAYLDGEDDQLLMAALTWNRTI